MAGLFLVISAKPLQNGRFLVFWPDLLWISFLPRKRLIARKSRPRKPIYKLSHIKMTNETDKTAGTVYEVAFHIVPTVSPENLSKEVDAIRAILEKNKAETITEEFPKLRSLAYQMVKAVGPARNKFDTAYFGWIKFEAPKETVVELDKALKASDSIIRHLIVKTVRENTIYGPKILAEEKKDARDAAARDEVKPEGREVKDVKPPMTPEELDKSIDKLVV